MTSVTLNGQSVTVLGDRYVVTTDGDSSVVLKDSLPADGEGWSFFVVELHGAGLDVETGVSVHKMRPFTAFWKTLEADWKGWSGEQTWESTEPGLTVTASHDGRHVNTLWTASQGVEPIWRASLRVPIEPGEQLSSIASEVEALLGGA